MVSVPWAILVSILILSLMKVHRDSIVFHWPKYWLNLWTKKYPRLNEWIGEWRVNPNYWRRRYIGGDPKNGAYWYTFIPGYSFVYGSWHAAWGISILVVCLQFARIGIMFSYWIDVILYLFIFCVVFDIVFHKVDD